VSLSAVNGDATINETDGITITNATIGGSFTVNSNIGLAANDSSIGNMALGSINADTINLDANEGAIVDAGSNLTANSITLAAASGIGGGGINYSGANGFGNLDSSGSINMETSTLSVINQSADGPTMTSGVVNISNTGDVTVNDMRNYGDIIFGNSGDIILDVITPGEGAIDANYGGNISDSPYGGSVAILNGNLSNVSTTGFGFGEADITAENLFVNNVYEFGTQSRPIRLRINNQFTLFASQGAVSYIGNRPINVTTSADFALLVINGITGLSGQQLIELESLGEIDPAIFTEVRNYNYGDVAILLPADQRYDDEEDNDDEKKRKKRKALVQ